MSTWRITAVAVVAACGDAPARTPVATLEDPATCGGCHGQHHDEWAGSMHAFASDDPVFVAMNARGQRETGGLLGTFCVQCHAPMAVALGLTDGRSFDPAALPPEARGVTCYFCHDVAAVHGARDNGLVLAFDDTMRGGVSDPTDNPAHRSAFDPALMASATNGSTLCGSCHDVVTQRGIALERTFQEWQTTTRATTCTGCHMSTATVDPPTTLIADADQHEFVAKSRPDSFHEHRWPAIDQAAFAGADAAAAQAAAIHRDLDPAVAIVGASGGGGICVTAAGAITVRIATHGIGHAWPSGAAHDRRAWLELTAYDAGGAAVFSSGAVSEATDPEALADPNLVGLWDRTFAEGGAPAHFFWEVATVQSQLIPPPASGDPAVTASFVVGTGVAGTIDHIAARVRIRPFARAALDDLVASGDLDAAVAAASLGTLDIAATDRTWVRADVDPATDGCAR